MKNKNTIDPERVRGLLEWLGMKLLSTDGGEPIDLSHEIVREIIAILSVLPAGKRGRPHQWDYNTEITAIFDMLNGKPVNVLAREIAEQTGQPEPSAQRRLWALRKTKRFTNWQPKQKNQ